MLWERRQLMAILAASILTTTARASERLTIGSLAAERSGTGGRPLIFIPGLAGGAWSWEDMVLRFAPSHEVYALNLPGFSGQPATSRPLIDHVVADILTLIETRKLRQPVLIGHSLGAFIAWRIATQSASLLGGIVALDGYPVFAPLADASLPARHEAAEKLAANLGRGKSQAEFRAAINGFLRARMNNPATADAMTEHAGRSDPEAVADYLMEMLPADLRPNLHNALVPALALVATESYKKGLSDSDMLAFYRRMLAGAPMVSIVLIHGARHFLEADQPEAVGAAIETFLADLDRRSL